MENKHPQCGNASEHKVITPSSSSFCSPNFQERMRRCCSRLQHVRNKVKYVDVILHKVLEKELESGNVTTCKDEKGMVRVHEK